MRIALSLLAYAFLTVGVWSSPELTFTPSRQVAAESWCGLFLVLAALGLAITGACRWNPSTASTASMGVWYAAMGMLVGVELFWMYRVRPSSYRDPSEYEPWLTAFRTGAWLLLLLVASYAWRGWPWPRLRLIVFLGVYTVLGAWFIAVDSGRPRVDVWLMQQGACAQLVRGQDPYAAEYEHGYSDEHAAAFLGPKLLKDGKIQSMPYPPSSLLLTVPGYLLGDVRWSYLAALIGTALLMLAIGRRLGLPPGHPAELAVWLFLFHPHGWAVLQLGWTEPFLALALTGFLGAIVAGWDRVSFLPLAGIVSLKQYGILALPSIGASRRLKLRPILLALAVAAATALPFLLWNPAAFWRGVVGFPINGPFRGDTLSVPAVVAALTGHRPSPVWGFLATAIVISFLLWRQRPDLDNVVLGCAAVYLTFFVFGKGAHVNYYWLVALLLALAVLLSIAENSVSKPKSELPAISPSL